MKENFEIRGQIIKKKSMGHVGRLRQQHGESGRAIWWTHRHGLRAGDLRARAIERPVSTLARTDGPD